MSATAWDEHYATEAGARHWPCEELVRFCSDKVFEKALDIGAGTGSNLKLLAMTAEMVVAIEPNEKARGLIGLHPGIEILDGEAGDLCECYEEEFDLVTDVQTSQHITWAEHPKVYAEYARVLRPGGTLWLFHLESRTKCAGRKKQSHWGGALYDWESLDLFPTLELFCMPRRAVLAEAVEAAGLIVEELRGLTREYPDGQAVSYAIITARKPA